ncbi:hypothetical protein Tco_0841227 [Tanacetum coccineum]|uniref:Uncharacterized protein n=1 Tax=Tanacetum coccineum TaxID=301880 RepID=A0ABQ5AW16_9ASTR
MFEFLKNHCIHEGWVVYEDFDDLVYIRSMFGHIGFECLLEINEQIVPRFILEFYGQYPVNYILEGQMLIEFVIHDQFFSYTIEEFSQILGIPYNGACSFFDKWSLDDLKYSVPTGGPYQTDPPFSNEIKNYVQKEREGHVTRNCHDKVIDVEESQILTREIVSVMKTWVKIICENVFCLGGNRDHIPGCLCHMLYCIDRSERYNLAYFIAKQMEFVTKQPRLILPYGILLTRLFKHVMSESPELSNDCYVLYDCVMYPLIAQQERKARKDYGTRRGRLSVSASSSLFTFGHPSSSHPNDDDNDGNDEGTSCVSTPSATHFVNLFKKDGTTTPDPITKSSSLSPPNAPLKTSSTKDTSSTFGTTSSSFDSKPQSSPLSSNDTPSPQPSNPFLDDIMDASPIPLNPLPFQSHPSLDITLSLSPITPLDHILGTPSPHSPPQPPLIGYLIFFNMFDYHGVNCLCCFHNRNLIFSLRDEMNLMFAHLEFLLTSAIASPSPPHP